MKILGLVGSRRKLGNSELLVKEALKVARDEGASVEIMRTTDLYVQECNGCMACIIRKQPCRLKDDISFLGEKLDAADGLVVAAPSYHHHAPASMMMLDYRLLGLVMDRTPRKKAISIGLAAIHIHAGEIVPNINYFIREAGFEVINSMLAISAGPGEVLIPERADIPKEVGRMTRDLVFALKGEESRLSPYVNKLRVFNARAEGDTLYTEENCCPYCFSQAFSFISPTELQCIYCHVTTPGMVSKDGDVAKLDFGSWSKEAVFQGREKHHSNWVTPTGGWFQQRREEINALREQYTNTNIGMPWLVPPSGEANLPSLEKAPPVKA
ncbi:flavodoxin family protein [Chloroflexota bacterium]